MNKQKFFTAGIIIGAGFLISACSSTTAPSPSPQPIEEASMSNQPASMNHSMTVIDEKDFLNQMIPHHQEAIDTSKILMAQTSDTDLKKFSQDVITVQTTEVSQMKNWLKEWYQYDYVPNTSYMPMMGDVTTLQGTELEKAYIQGMIGHHQGAIEMARQVLTMNPKPEIKTMANDIITVQSAEVAMLQGWLSSKYGMQSSNPAVDHNQMGH